MEIIVKYSNRKMYSKVQSKYVNLNYIINLVKTESPFKVLKYKKNTLNDNLEDITNKVLLESLSLVDLDKEFFLKTIKEY